MKDENLDGAEIFATTIADMEPNIMTECEKFGMSWGCLPTCPVLRRGECEMTKEVIELFKREVEKNSKLGLGF